MIHVPVIELDTLVQRSASSAEEFASLSEEMAAQSDELLRALQFFKFETGKNPASSAVEKKPVMKPALKAPAVKPGLPPSPQSVQTKAETHPESRFGEPQPVHHVRMAQSDAPEAPERSDVTRNQPGAQNPAKPRNVIARNADDVPAHSDADIAAAEPARTEENAAFDSAESSGPAFAAQEYVPNTYVSDSDFEEF